MIPLPFVEYMKVLCANADMAADTIPVLQVSDPPNNKELIGIINANTAKLQAINLAFFFAAQARLPEGEKYREKAHQLIDVLYDTIHAYGEIVAKGIEGGGEQAR